MKIKAVIFDLDGTLTEPLLDFNRIRKEMELDSDAGVLEAMDHMSSLQRQKAEVILHKHEEHAAINSRLNRGADEVLAQLKQAGYPIGLLTRNTMKNALFVAQKHCLVFDAILDRNSGPAKPDGFGVQKLCETFGVEPSETLLVGDFLHDMQAAHNAGAIAVLLKTHTDADKFETFSDYSIYHLENIFDIIRKIENV